jgi:hypothetical protein
VIAFDANEFSRLLAASAPQTPLLPLCLCPLLGSSVKSECKGVSADANTILRSSMT